MGFGVTVNTKTGYNNQLNKLINFELSSLNKWGLCNRKGGNSREKPNLLLYAKYVFYAERRTDMALTHFIFFPVVSSLSIAKAPNIIIKYFSICLYIYNIFP